MKIKLNEKFERIQQKSRDLSEIMVSRTQEVDSKNNTVEGVTDKLKL